MRVTAQCERRQGRGAHTSPSSAPLDFRADAKKGHPSEKEKEDAAPGPMVGPGPSPSLPRQEVHVYWNTGAVDPGVG